MTESRRFLGTPLFVSIRRTDGTQFLGAPAAQPFAASPAPGGDHTDPGVYVHMTYAAEGPPRNWLIRTYDAHQPVPAPIGQHLATVAVPILSPDGLVRVFATVHVFIEETDPS